MSTAKMAGLAAAAAAVVLSGCGSSGSLAVPAVQDLPSPATPSLTVRCSIVSGVQVYHLPADDPRYPYQLQDRYLRVTLTNGNASMVPVLDANIGLYDAQGNLIGTDSVGFSVQAVAPGATVSAVGPLLDVAAGAVSCEPRSYMP